MASLLYSEELANPKSFTGALTGPMTAVNSRLQVRNVQNLSVVNASIMPQITIGNTNATTMMIGLKGADMILVDNNLSS